MPRLVLLLSFLAASTGIAHAQAFGVNTTDVPQGSPGNDSNTEQVDFADIDLDGDWDAVFADGGDSSQDQNRVWVNLGGLQGGVTGEFADETATRMPPILDQSRDVEFADIDGDGDVDLYVANTATISTTGVDRFQVNTGGAQPGTLGFFADETASRWVGLGGSGSSVWPDLVQAGGGFYDWTSDAEFADLDNDGDLDLFKSTVGQSHNGMVPSRVFLNDGAGFFEEFNPAGVQLAGSTIPNETPALWAEGLQFDNTADVTGSFADVATVAIDSDLMDLDNDLDIDVLLGDRGGNPRVLLNRMDAGTFLFRDNTSDAFISGHTAGAGGYDQELGDLDNDGDLDLYGLNWGSFTDRTFENDGSGFFSDTTLVDNSGSDDEEADFIDFDNDGDLDVIVANFSGADRLYRNLLSAGEFSLQWFGGAGLTGTTVGRDVEVADVDGDGDYDAFIASANGGNLYYENVTQNVDDNAPSIPLLEDVADGPAYEGVLPVRAQVYDNAPYYVSWYNDTELQLAVDGVPIGAVPMKSSGAQVFRGEIPGNLVGSVIYLVRSQDEYLNKGFSAVGTYEATGATGLTAGDASNGAQGEPVLRALSSSFGGMKHYLLVENLTPGATGVIVAALQPLSPSVDLGDGLVLNILPPFLATLPVTAGVNGTAVLAVPIPEGIDGASISTQLFALDGAGAATWASSRSLTFTVF